VWLKRVVYLAVSMAEAYSSCISAINCTGKSMPQSLQVAMAVVNLQKYTCSEDRRQGKRTSFSFLGRPCVSSVRAYVLLLMFPFTERSPSSLSRSMWNFATYRTCVQLYIIQIPKFGGLPPKKNLGPKREQIASISDSFRFRSQMSPERIDISKIVKLICRQRFLHHSVKKVRWTLVHWQQSWTCEFGHTENNIFGRPYFGPKWALLPQISTRARQWQRLASAHTNGYGVTQQFLTLNV